MSTPSGITDARGRKIPLRPYCRVVSLVPSLTETVARLKAAEALVARTVYCTEPRSLASRVPACGGTKNPDLAAILAQRPDLVLACLEENKVEHLDTLERAGVPVFAVMPRRLDDISSLLRDFGTLLGRRVQAGRFMADLTNARLACGQVRARLLRGGTGPRVAVLIWKNPWMAAGSGTVIDAMCAEVGLVNACAGRRDYFTVTVEALAALDLDAVLLPDEPWKFTHHDAWALAAAAVVPDRRRAILLDGKLLSWYGSRTPASLRTLGSLLLKRLAPAEG